MAIVRAYPYYNGWSGSDTEASEPWIVETNDIATTVPEIVYSSLLPSVGDSHPYNLLYVIQQGGITATRRDKNGLFWDVNVNYSLQGGTSSTDGRLVSFRVGTQTYSKAITQCYDYTLDVGSSNEFSDSFEERELPIRNSAYNSYDPADLLSEDYNTLLVWSQRESGNFDYADAMEQQGSINEVDITILGVPIPAKKGLMRKINPVAQLAGDGTLIEWVTEYEVEIADTDHNLRLLDSGFYAYFGDPGTATKREILQGDVYEGDTLTAKEKKKGVKVAQLLDGGFIMTQDEIETNGGGYYNHYRTKPFVNWNVELDLISGRVD